MTPERSRSKQSLLQNFQTNKSKKLNELRKENEFCDLILKSEDGFEIGVHKVVVSAASNYFKDLLTSSMIERTDKIILIPGISGHILEKIISFMYTNEFEEKMVDVEEISKYAVIFQLEELLKICSMMLSESINDHTCLNYWRLARDHLIYDSENNYLAYIANKAEYLSEHSFLNDLTLEEMKCLLAVDRLQWAEENKFDFVWNWAAGQVSSTKTSSEVFAEVADFFNFSKLKDEFIISRIFCNDDFLDNVELMKKIAKLTKKKEKSHDKENDEITTSRLVFPKSATPKILGLGSNKMFIGLGEEHTIVKEKVIVDDFGYTTFNNRLLLCGGRSSACEYFEPIIQDWKKFPAMKSVKSGHSCSYFGNKIYACGGYESKSVEIFDLDKEEWYSGPQMLSNNHNFGLTEVKGALYAIGGISEDVEFLDTRTLKWSVANKEFPNSDKLFTRSVSIGPYIYCLCSDIMYCFDTRINKFSDVEVSPIDAKSSVSICEIGGYIYSFGYWYNSDKYSLKLDQFDCEGTQGYTKLFEKCNVPTSTALVTLYY